MLLAVNLRPAPNKADEPMVLDCVRHNHIDLSTIT